MGLLDRDYMRQAPRTHVGETQRGGQPPLPPPSSQYSSTAGAPGGFGHVVRQIMATVIALLVVAFIASLLGWRTPWGSVVTVTPPHPVATSGTAGSSALEYGVHLCAPQDYAAKYLACRHDLKAVSLYHLSRVHLSVTGKEANDFTATTLSVAVDKQNAAGSFTNVGSTTMSAGLSYDVLSLPLNALFSNASITPTRGTYHIEVDEGTTLLGAATIRIV